MNTDFTIFFTFVCDSEIRREYIRIAIKTLFKDCNLSDVPVLVIDGSSQNAALENEEIFSSVQNLIYIHDEESNPFKRCYKYLDLIKTKFVLRLLEDAAFINFSKNKFYYVKKDMELLNRNRKIDAVHYLMVDDNKYSFRNNTLYYSPIEFEGKLVSGNGEYSYYSHSQNGYLYHYLCNNLLYRRELIISQWGYLAENYLTHNDAEAGNINRRVYKGVSNIRYVRGVVRLFYRFYEKLFWSRFIINEAVITQTSIHCDAIHIGYHRVEMHNEKYSKTNNGLELKNLRMFNDLTYLKKMKFQRHQNK